MIIMKKHAKQMVNLRIDDLSARGLRSHLLAPLRCKSQAGAKRAADETAT